jgi:DNA-directed RNA polymerase specialized sigma24 family protein
MTATADNSAADNPAADNPQRLRDAIVAVANASRRGDRDGLNQALEAFSRVAEPILRPAVAGELRRRRVGGPDGMVAAAEDILSILLWRLVAEAHQCNANTDDEATKWLKKVVTHLIEDQAKTPRRRLRLLMERLLGFGYYHDSWGADQLQPNQKPPADDARGSSDPNP